MKNITPYILLCILSCITLGASAQGHIYRTPIVRVQPTLIIEDDTVPAPVHKFYNDTLVLDTTMFRNRPSMMPKASELDTLLNQLKTKLESPDFYKIEVDTTIETLPIPRYFFRQPVFCGYNSALNDTIDTYISAMTPQEEELTLWLARKIAHNRRLENMKQNYMMEHPNKVQYNIETLPIAPKRVFSTIDPSASKITVQQNIPTLEAKIDANIKRRNWIHSFNSLLQFSQAYNSPNWYQGGTNDLNLLFNVEFNIKLNETFHPNLLFDNTIKYKLAMNSTPDNPRDYNINDDIFQINTKFGVRAAKRWFYSVQAQFKTQLFNGYNNNDELKTALLSPGELNVGLGMTYNYISPKKTFTFDASISPLSYNMKTCINSRVNENDFGIETGRKTVNEIGSSGELKLKWNIAHNISFASRIFAFSDYTYFQGDMENTLAFNINRFLSTQINVNLRYDTSVPSDVDWHRLQLKEILSFGFSYNFKNL
ncbi:MAG: DUF3078 domain-containing protein [Muribaculaceae bacterium]|nr:DUF3078 domain-containing protein [Muribaculaceae bacterium]